MLDVLFKSNLQVAHELAEKFKVARINRRMTQQDLSEKTGVNRMTISRLEKGENISLISFIALIRGVGKLEEFTSILEQVLPDPRLKPIPVKKRFKKS